MSRMQVASIPGTGIIGDALVSVAFESVLVVDDVSWRVVAATPATEELYGGPLIGVALETVFSLDVVKAIDELVRSAEAGPTELTIERRDGSVRTVIARATRLVLDGCTACLIALADVTRERALEAELARERAFRRTLLDALGIGVMAIDTSGRILDHNRFDPVERVYGSELAGKNFFLDLATGADARRAFQRFQQWAHAVDSSQYAETFEFEVGGRILEAELHAGARAGDADALVRLSDATDRLSAERELRHQTYQAEEAARRSRLVYQTASLIHRSLGLDEVFETAVAETGRLLSASRCQIILLGDSDDIRLVHEYRRANLAPIEMFEATLDSSPLVAAVVRGLTTLVVENAEMHPQADIRGLLAVSGARATLVAPIAVGREARGVLAIHDCDHPRHWSDADVELAASIGSQVGLAIFHTESHDRVRRQAEREAIVGRLAAKIHAAGSLERALEIAATTLAEVLSATAIHVSLDNFASAEARSWIWTAADRRLAARSNGDADLPHGPHVVVGKFAVRDGSRGAIRVDLPAGPDADTQTLVEAVAVHVGVAVGATGLFEAVAAAKALWEETFDAMADGIVVTDTNSQIVRANKAFMRLMKLDPSNLLDTDFSELISSENREALRAARDRVMSTRRHADISFFETPIGRHLSLSVSRFATAATPTFIYVVRDVTEGQMIAERLTQSAKMASIGHLAAGVAHEINTPLATISGSAQSLARQLAAIPELADGPRWQSISDRLEAIVGQAFRCKRITHDLLNFAAPTRPTIAPADILRVTREAIDMVERERGEGRVALVDEGIRGGVPTDAELLRQVLINLVANAIDAVDDRGEGTVTVTVRGLARAARIVVRDTGLGIADADLERIFDPFFTTKPPGRGTGLGLSISHNIVSSLGGRLEVRSRVGRGSTFTIRLPIAKSKG